MKSWTGWLLLVSWNLTLFYISSSHSLCHSHDSFALLHFKTSFTINTTFYDNPDSAYDYYCGHVNQKTATWENGTDCCSWDGVSCHPISGHVIGLDLSCSGLYGNIHQNSTLFHLSHLHSLNLAFNNFSYSPFSSLFGRFESLTYLNLSYSYFKGEIPSLVSHLSRLQSLDLSYNYELKWKESTWKRLLQNTTVLRELVLDETDMSLTSMRTLNLSSSLVTLSLEGTQITGKLTNDILCLPNLHELQLSDNYHFQVQQLRSLSCSAASLSILHLSWCQFKGSIPASFSNLTHLTSLDLSGNQFKGSIPASFSNLTHLTSLHLSSNNLNGSIPASFSNLTHLTSLDLSYNNLNGSIPASFSNLTHLTSLHLSSNYLNGSIPSSLLTLPNLTFLYLSENDLSGQIPDVFPQSNKFEELDLSYNNIGGELPSTLSNLQNLIELDLSNNKLSGQIPDVFAGLTKLSTLRLLGNNLRGQIPSSLFDLTQLSDLVLSYNKLEGPLPNKITGFPNLTLLRLDNNLLNGTIPSWCLSLPSLLDLDLSYNQFTGHVSEISSYSMDSLYLCNNKLQGNIPQSIFSLVNLTDLCLSSNSFSGPVNFSLFSKLQSLESLYLSENNLLSLNFNSNVNYKFSNLRGLYLSSMGLNEFPKLSKRVPFLEQLDLSNNKLNGTIPEWLHEMNSLQYLNLSQNLLKTPMGKFSRNYQLGYLDLSFNLLSGGISSSICNASSIGFLNLSHNKLTGIIPQCLANLSRLSVLDLQMNELYGTLPNTFANNNELTNLNLNGNQLQGRLPKSLFNCTYLEVLNLGNNQIEDTFPQWLQTLPDLKVLVLRANKLYGTIAGLKTKNGFPSLIIFDISFNNLSGPIPKVFIKKFKAMKKYEVDSSLQQYIESDRDTRYGEYIDSVTLTVKAMSMTLSKIPKNFVNIDLSRNKFEGEIPIVIGELHALKGLNFSHNRFSGPIPQSMGNLTNLESLDLSSNMLTGRIPTELTNLNFLEVLNLSNNRLVGEIPQGKQFGTFLNDSYEGNLGLCGVPLSKKCKEDPEQHSSPSKNMWREERFGFGWKPVAIGYGCGMVFGVGLGCYVFLMRKPQWLVRMIEG